MVVNPLSPQILAPTPSAPSACVNPNTKSRGASIPKTRDASTTALHSMHYIVAALATTIAVVCILDTQRKPSHIRVLSPAYLAQLKMDINTLWYVQRKIAQVEAAIETSNQTRP